MFIFNVEALLCLALCQLNMPLPFEWLRLVNANLCYLCVDNKHLH